MEPSKFSVKKITHHNSLLPLIFSFIEPSKRLKLLHHYSSRSRNFLHLNLHIISRDYFGSHTFQSRLKHVLSKHRVAGLSGQIVYKEESEDVCISNMIKLGDLLFLCMDRLQKPMNEQEQYPVAILNAKTFKECDVIYTLRKVTCLLTVCDRYVLFGQKVGIICRYDVVKKELRTLYLCQKGFVKMIQCPVNIITRSQKDSLRHVACFKKNGQMYFIDGESLQQVGQFQLKKESDGSQIQRLVDVQMLMRSVSPVSRENNIQQKFIENAQIQINYLISKWEIWSFLLMQGTYLLF